MMPEETKQINDPTMPEETKQIRYAVIDIDEMVRNRLHKPRGLLQNDDAKLHHKNIAFAISLYESGQLPDLTRMTWIADGKVLDGSPCYKDLPEGSTVWREVRLPLIFNKLN